MGNLTYTGPTSTIARAPNLIAGTSATNARSKAIGFGLIPRSDLNYYMHPAEGAEAVEAGRSDPRRSATKAPSRMKQRSTVL